MKVWGYFMELDEKILLPVKFDYMLLDKYLKSNGIKRNYMATYIGRSESCVSQILGGTKEPSIETAVRIARYTGLSLDLLYGIETTNIIQENVIPNEIIDTIKEYLSNATKTYIITTIKKDKENKYKRIINSLTTTKVDGKYGNETFMQLFAESVLDVLVNAKLNDTTFMELFTESANKLSIEINKFKTRSIGDNKLDLEFQQILDKSNEIKGLYENTLKTLQNAIDIIFHNTLENEFNAIKPDVKLF